MLRVRVTSGWVGTGCILLGVELGDSFSPDSPYPRIWLHLIPCGLGQIIGRDKSESKCQPKKDGAWLLDQRWRGQCSHIAEMLGSSWSGAGGRLGRTELVTCQQGHTTPLWDSPLPHPPGGTWEGKFLAFGAEREGNIWGQWQVSQLVAEARPLATGRNNTGDTELWLFCSQGCGQASLLMFQSTVNCMCRIVPQGRSI